MDRDLTRLVNLPKTTGCSMNYYYPCKPTLLNPKKNSKIFLEISLKTLKFWKKFRILFYFI